MFLTAEGTVVVSVVFARPFVAKMGVTYTFSELKGVLFEYDGPTVGPSNSGVTGLVGVVGRLTVVVKGMGAGPSLATTAYFYRFGLVTAKAEGHSVPHSGRTVGPVFLCLLF